jgi:hypothetical protein
MFGKKKIYMGPLKNENFFNVILLNTTKDISKICCLCQCEENLEFYSIKSFTNIKKKYNLNKNKYKLYNWKYLQENSKIFFELLYVAKNYKRIILCHTCSSDIHLKKISNDNAKKLVMLLKKRNLNVFL